MASIITTELKRFLAEQVIEALTEVASSTIYLAIGKVDPWANDQIASTPINSVNDVNGVWSQIHFLKNISGSDIALVSRRIDYTANTVYDAYTHDADLSNLNYYVLTSDFNVYKCLDNNGGIPSTIEPTYTGTSTTNRTADGYLWKYMYSISRSQQLKFLTSDWMPVSELTLDNGSPQYRVQSAAIDGSIEAIKITNNGIGFSSSISTTITITGDGTGAAANAIANTVTNTIQYIAVTSKGSGYTWANVAIESSNVLIANGATAQAIISPYGGHGSAPPSELDVQGFMINVRIKGDEDQLIKVGNNFRQISLIRDPITTNGNVASNSVINQVTTLTLSGSGGSFVEDEWVFQGPSIDTATFKGIVVWYESNEMQVTNTSGTIQSTTLRGHTSAATRFVAGYTSPLLESRSGKVLYIDNRVPINRANNQTENIQIPIIF